MTRRARTTVMQAIAYLSDIDPLLARIIKQSPVCDITAHQDYYGALVSSIIGQQLSVRAAATIKSRFMGLFNDRLPTPEQLLNSSTESLRAVGLSRAKTAYIVDLAAHCVDGRLKFDQIPILSNEAIVTELTNIKGIGEWTVHMFLIFCVGRLDVLPSGDLGIRNAARLVYGLEQNPTPTEVRELAARRQWHPYESVASWYLWRSLDNTPAL